MLPEKDATAVLSPLREGTIVKIVKRKCYKKCKNLILVNTEAKKDHITKHYFASKQLPLKKGA